MHQPAEPEIGRTPGQPEESAAVRPEEVRAQRHLEALLRTSEPLQPLTDPESVARLAAEQGAALIPGIQCAVVLREPADPTLLRLAGASGDIFAGLVGTTMPLSGSLAERAMAAGRPVETADAAQESPIAAQISGAPSSARLVPLRVTELGGQAVTLGIIGYYRDGRDGFIVEERRLLDEYALRVAMSLHRALLLEAATKTAHRLAVGFEAAMELGAELEPRRLVRRLIERVTAAVDADRASFGRVDGDVVVIEDSVATPAEAALRPGSTWNVEAIELLHAAVHEHRPAQMSRGTAPPSAAELIGGMERVLIVPLLQQGRTVAVISVGRLRDQVFDDDALAVLQQVGTIAVLALRNARLFEARRDFMNMAAHELRTPLTVLNGYLSMLRDGTFGPPSERWLRPVDVMAGKVAELARLVDDLLIGARLERGVVRSEARRIDLVDAARAAVERARPRAEMLGGRITFHDGVTSLDATADADNLGKIIDNLLNNALTYTLGAPEVEVSVEADGDVARVSVQDRGRGIPEALHERVFEQFFRIEDRGLGYPLGTGLGLYISRQLAEAHGGRLRIERSAPGDGSVFVLELPVSGGGDPLLPADAELDLP